MDRKKDDERLRKERKSNVFLKYFHNNSMVFMSFYVSFLSVLSPLTVAHARTHAHTAQKQWVTGCRKQVDCRGSYITALIVISLMCIPYAVCSL